MEELDLYISKHTVECPRVREACRAVVIREGMILLSYEVHTDQWFLPGGGMEPGETEEESCIRELAEETGYAAAPVEQFLTIREHCRDWRYVTHYFFCRITGEVPRQLTAGEQAAGLEPRWLPLEKAVELFSRYADHAENPMKLGAYRREFTALSAWIAKRGK